MNENDGTKQRKWAQKIMDQSYTSERARVGRDGQGACLSVCLSVSTASDSLVGLFLLICGIIVFVFEGKTNSPWALDR